MANDYRVTIQGKDELITKLKQLGEVASQRNLELAVTAGALPIQNAAKDNAPMKTRTLSRSIHTEVTESDESHATATVGTDLVYAAIQEFGGTIVPKNAKFLAIPVTDTAASYKPRMFPGKLHVQGYGGMVAMLVDEQGITQYALKSSVTIPAHPYLRPALSEHTQDAADAAGAVLKQLIDQATL
jgi:HK97 gp10 family phage protein